MGIKKKEITWRFKVDSTGNQRKCIKRFVQIARRSVKSFLNPGEIVRFTAGIVIQSAKIAAAKEVIYATDKVGQTK